MFLSTKTLVLYVDVLMHVLSMVLLKLVIKIKFVNILLLYTNTNLGLLQCTLNFRIISACYTSVNLGLCEFLWTINIMFFFCFDLLYSSSLLNCYLQNKYEKRIIERDLKEVLGDNVSSRQFDNTIILEFVGGVDKKGHIYGLGPEVANYKLSTSSRSDGISPSNYEQIRIVIFYLSLKKKTLKKKIKTHEDLIRASQKNPTHICLENNYFGLWKVFLPAINLHIQIKIHLHPLVEKQ